MSDMGRVRSERGARKTHVGLVLKPQRSTDGYPMVRLYHKPEKAKTVKIHRLVALAFLGDPGSNEVNHKDGVKTNNTLGNLEYVTRTENIRHMRRIGLGKTLRGTQVKNCKLTEDDVAQMKRRFLGGETTVSLGKSFGVSQAAAWNITHGKSWSHVEAAG